MFLRQRRHARACQSTLALLVGVENRFQVEPCAIVLDDQEDLSSALFKHDGDISSMSMLGDVIESLLSNAIKNGFNLDR